MLPDKVRKRDGRVEDFEEMKVIASIKKALTATNTEYSVDLLYDLLEARSLVRCKKATITVEKLQDYIEEVLMKETLYSAARAYVVYRYQRRQFRDKKDVVNKIVDEYVGKTSWRVNENSNITYSYPAMQGAIANNVISNYTLNSIYPQNVSEAHLRGDFHIHDLAMGTAAYCAGWDLRTLLIEGFGGVPGKLNSRPPSHLASAVDQMINFFGVLQNEWAGAMAFNSFDTFLAPYIKIENLSKAAVKQCMENFIYGVNVTSRWGQSPFSNITLDFRVPKDLAKDPVIIAGKEVGFTYGDCQKEVDLINEAFWEVMLEGDASQLPFTFPIPTVNITKDFNYNSKISNLIFEVAAKYGIPYFQNFVNSDLNPSDVRSMCPLTADTKVIIRSKFGTSRTNINVLRNQQHIEVLSNGRFVTGKFVKTEPQKIITIKTRNGISTSYGESHLCYTNTGIKRAADITKDDYMPYSLLGYEHDPLLGSYDLGRLVGLYIAEGSGSFREPNTYVITFSLNTKKDVDLISFIISYAKSLGFHSIQSYDKKHPVVNVSVFGEGFYKIIHEYIDTGIATTKALCPKVFRMSKLFRRGIVDGWMEGDGSKTPWHNSIYTSSLQLRNDLVDLCSSIGQLCNINCTAKGEHVGRFSTRPNYQIRLYKFTTKTKTKDTWFIDGDKVWFKVDTSIVEPKRDTYCFTVDDPSSLFTLANGLITHNCRLSLNLEEIRKHTGGIFGANSSTGSIGVVTLNLPRLGYTCKTEEELFEKLDDLAELAKDSLVLKRKVINTNLGRGLFPYTKRYLGTFKNHFSTLGVLGAHEMCLNFLGKGIETEEGKDLVTRVLMFLRSKTEQFTTETGSLFNLEAAPCEGTSYRLASIDKKQFPNIITSGEDVFFYTNSSHLPVGHTDDLFEALDHQDSLQCLYTSGTVIHLFTGERLTAEGVKMLVKKVCNAYKLPFFSITPTFSVCPDHKYISGEHFKCPTCGKECSVFSRVVGYLRKVSDWNSGKREEFKLRKTYKLS